MLGVFGKFALAGAAGGTGITGNVYAASSAGAEAGYAFLMRYFPVISVDNCPAESCTCGRKGRVELETTGGNGFTLDFVGAASDARPTGDEFTVAELEHLFESELTNFSTANLASSWADFQTTFFAASLDRYITAFRRDGVPHTLVKWKAKGQLLFKTYYSLVLRVQGTQAVFEIISASQPVMSREELRLLPEVDERFRFQPSEVPEVPEGYMVPLQVSRAASDIDSIVEFYKTVLDEDPVETRAFTGGNLVKFRLGGSVLLQYITRDASMSNVSISWIEGMMNRAHARYMTSYRSCLDVWTDTHFVLEDNDRSIDKIVRKYEEHRGRTGFWYHALRRGSEDGSIVATDPSGWSMKLQGKYLGIPFDAEDTPSDNCYESCVIAQNRLRQEQAAGYPAYLALPLAVLALSSITAITLLVLNRSRVRQRNALADPGITLVEPLREAPESAAEPGAVA
jgi:hypothetical protein